MSSALSITTAVNPPRAVYLDFPLGHTAGKANDQSINRRIMIDTLSAFESIQVPGKIKTLKYRWAQDDAWKDSVMRPGKRKHAHADNRVERVSAPQYQNTDDELAAMQAMEQDGCPTCIWLTSD